jgi:prepilin-type N-terminal cleavage/methylation domain-containing protein
MRGQANAGAGGRGGFTLLEILVVVTVIAIIAAIAIPSLAEARKGANEGAAINNLRQIHIAQELFRAEDKDKDKDGRLQYASDLLTLYQKHALFDAALARGSKQGYAFRIASADEYSFVALASPKEPGRSGDRHFRIDDLGVLRYSVGGEPDETSPPIGGH